MIQRAFVYLAIVAVMAATLACRLPGLGPLQGSIVRGSGRMIEESRNVGEIAAVSLATIGTLHIEVGNETALRISAEDNIVPVIRTDVTGGRLTIDTQPNTNIHTTRPVDYYLTVVDLSEVSLSSSGDAEAGDLDANHFTVRISSSGGFTMGDLSCQDLTVRLSSSGNARIAGATGATLNVAITSSGSLTIGGGSFDSQDVRLSSSGDYNAREVKTNTAALRLSSSGSATVWVEESLSAQLSSSGSVRYAGNPALDWHSSSSGTLRSVP